MTKSQLTYAILPIIIIFFGTAMVVYHTQTDSLRSTNSGSRYATVEALVHDHTFSIDKTRYTGKWSIDRVKIGDHYYSSKPPLLPALAAGFYWGLHRVTGWDIRARGDEERVIFICNLATGGIPFLLILIYYWRLSPLFIASPGARILALLGIAFSYIGAGYATELNNHIPGALMMLMTFYYACRIRRNHDDSVISWIAVGLCSGLLITFELPAGILVASLIWYLFTYNRKKTLMIILPFAAIPILAQLGLTYMFTDSILPVYLRAEFYDYSGSYWHKPQSYDAPNDARVVYMFHSLLGHHGFFGMTPVFILAAIALFSHLNRKNHLWMEAGIIAVSFIVMMVFYIIRTDNYGGLCVGFRWLVVIMPLFFLFFGVWVDKHLQSCSPKSWVWLAIFLGLAISQYHTLDCLESSWKQSRWESWWQEKWKTCCHDENPY
jgi:hypothetical protein